MVESGFLGRSLNSMFAFNLLDKLAIRLNFVFVNEKCAIWFVTSLEIQPHLRREYCESYIGLEEIYWKSLLIKLSDSGWAFPH